MPQEGNKVTAARFGAGERLAGEDYEYIFGSIAEEYKENLEQRMHQKELSDEDERVNGILGEKNMAILNSLISGRGIIENWRDAYIDKRIQEKGTLANMAGKQDTREFIKKDGKQVANPDYGKWITADGDIAQFAPRGTVSDLSFWDKAKENLLGWHAGIVDLEDGKYIAPTEDGKKVSETTDTIDSPETTDNVKELSTMDLAKKIQSGDASKKEIESFQKSTGIDVDGEVGIQVKGAIDNVLNIGVDEEEGDLPPDDAWGNIKDSNDTSALATDSDPNAVIEKGSSRKELKDDPVFNIDSIKDDVKVDDKKVSAMMDEFQAAFKMETTVIADSGRDYGNQINLPEAPDSFKSTIIKPVPKDKIMDDIPDEIDISKSTQQQGNNALSNLNKELEKSFADLG